MNSFQDAITRPQGQNWYVGVKKVTGKAIVLLYNPNKNRRWYKFGTGPFKSYGEAQAYANSLNNI